jgi:hypothetical protein
MILVLVGIFMEQRILGKALVVENRAPLSK